MDSEQKAAWMTALRLWWSFAWRQLAVLAALTVGLGVFGALLAWTRLVPLWGIRALLPCLFWPLMIAAQVDTFRRLIRQYGLGGGPRA